MNMETNNKWIKIDYYTIRVSSIDFYSDPNPDHDYLYLAVNGIPIGITGSEEVSKALKILESITQERP